MNVGILFHGKIQEAQELTRKLEGLIEQSGHTAWHASVAGDDVWQPQMPGTDLLLTLGGDGSILRAASACARHNVAVLGVKFGRLGFLSELLPDQVEGELPRLLAGEYWLEERSMLSCRVTGREEAALALNEAMVSQGHLRRVLEMDVWIDNAYLARYTADALLVSTATGSTAYSMVAGGPILHPEVRNLLITPICAFRGPTTPFVLRESARLRIQVFHRHEAVLTVDGLNIAELEDGAMVDMSTANLTCNFARIHSRAYFYETLVQRLRLPLDGS